MIPAVWSVSFPINSHPTKFAEVLGKRDIAVNFYLILFGIDFKVNTQSLKIAPPEFKLKMQSISLPISNSYKDLTQAFGLNLTSWIASMYFSINFIPECAKMTLLKKMS
jgi:hypothetical protein